MIEKIQEIMQDERYILIHIREEDIAVSGNASQIDIFSGLAALKRQFPTHFSTVEQTEETPFKD